MFIQETKDYHGVFTTPYNVFNHFILRIKINTFKPLTASDVI